MPSLTDFLSKYTPVQYTAPTLNNVAPTDYGTKLLTWEDMQQQNQPTPTPAPAPAPNLNDIQMTLNLRDLADQNKNMFGNQGLFGRQNYDGQSYRAGEAQDSFYQLAQDKLGLNRDQATQYLGGYSPMIQGSGIPDSQLQMRRNQESSLGGVGMGFR